jgi:formate dehydrogenase subunit delta
MNIDNLVKMANQIGTFFEAEPDRDQALADIAGHIKRSWEPRMRRALLEHIDRDGGSGGGSSGGSQLKDIVMEAVRVHRDPLQQGTQQIGTHQAGTNQAH